MKCSSSTIFLFCIIALLLLGSVKTGVAQTYKRYHQTFYEGVDSFELCYFPGGVTATEARRLTKGTVVLPAGYYGNMSIGGVWRHDVVGYTVIKGTPIAKYLTKYGRPIFAIRDGTYLDIFGSFRSFQKANPAIYQFAREVDYVARDKSRPTGRTILAKKGGEIHAIVMQGRDKDCRQRLKKNKLDKKFVFLDGGSSLLPNALNPCYLVIRRGGLATVLLD